MSPSAALLQALVQSLWQLAAIGLLAELVLLALRGASAARRHAALMVSLLTMLAVPVITFIDCLRGGADPLLRVSLVRLRIPPELAGALQGWAPALWAAAALAMLVLHARALAWLRALERGSAALPAPWQARLDALRGAMGVTRAVAGRLADGLAGAFTVGLLRPVIWLPAALLTHLPAAQLEALLAHELAHIRRLDWLSNGIQCLAESLFFFHPAVWWLGRDLRRERELACDRLAVEAGADPLVLAQALAAAARTAPTAPRLALAAGGGELRQRVAHLLSGAAPRRHGWRLPAMLVLLLFTFVLAGEVTELRPWRHLLPPAPPAVPAPPPPPAPPAPLAFFRPEVLIT